MTSMKEIKTHIKSIKETKKITKAMKLISAAKLKRARIQLESTLPFFRKVKHTLAEILIHSRNIENHFFHIRKDTDVKKKAYFIISGDKSLAGGYNHNLINLAESVINDKNSSILYVAGNIGRNYFIKNCFNVVKSFDYIVQNPTLFRAREISEILLSDFSNEKFDEIYIIFTEMVNSISLETRYTKLLPLDMDLLKEELSKENFKIDESIIFEPSANEVFDILIPKYLKGIVYGALVESFTSEQSSRMTAMDNATANADEMLHDLYLYYNRARQASITQEISEIVGGAAALK